MNLEQAQNALRQIDEELNIPEDQKLGIPANIQRLTELREGEAEMLIMIFQYLCDYSPELANQDNFRTLTQEGHWRIIDMNNRLVSTIERNQRRARNGEITTPINQRLFNEYLLPGPHVDEVDTDQDQIDISFSAPTISYQEAGEYLARLNMNVDTPEYRHALSHGTNSEALLQGLSALQAAAMLNPRNFRALFISGRAAEEQAEFMIRQRLAALSEDERSNLLFEIIQNSSEGRNNRPIYNIIRHNPQQGGAAEASIVRPPPLRHIPLDAIPRQESGNERQRILKELNVDDSEDKINKLIDPITLEAIEYPCKINGDVNRYFEFHTLMALPRAQVPLDKEGVTFAPSIIRALEASGGDLQSFMAPETFAHPLTRIRHPDADIIDASIEYKTLFDETVKELTSLSQSSTTKELTPEEIRAARIERFKPGGGSSRGE